MAKEVLTGAVADLKKLLAANKLVIGTDETLKGLRKGKIKKVFLSSNVEAQVKGDVENLGRLGEVEIVQLDKTNEEIGVLCKKPFAISIVGVTA